MSALTELEIHLRGGVASHPPPPPALLSFPGIAPLGIECIYASDRLAAQTQWRWAAPRNFTLGYVKLALSDNQAALRPLASPESPAASAVAAAATAAQEAAAENLSEKSSLEAISYVAHETVVFMGRGFIFRSLCDRYE